MNRPPWGLKAGAPGDRRTRQPLDAPSGLGGRVSQHSSLDGADSLTSCCCHGRVICTVLAPFVANVLTETESTPRGFEPLRAEPNGFLVRHLSHSVTVSDARFRLRGQKKTRIFRHIARNKIDQHDMSTSSRFIRRFGHRGRHVWNSRGAAHRLPAVLGTCDCISERKQDRSMTIAN